MASQSPLAASPSRDYENGWIAISRMIESGASWSGRERNCAFLNTGRNRFSDISALSGLDLPDDARALAQCDWDGDGDLDLWFKNRTGPVLRVWRNERANAAAGGAQALSLLLVGKTCNRDAVGARVTVRAGGKSFVREVVAGDGFLSQSTRWLVFGLGAAQQLDEVSVRWPGGDVETFAGLRAGGRYRLVQGGASEALPLKAAAELVAKPAAPLEAPKSTVVVLRTPLPLPVTFNRAVGGVRAGRARLVQVWSRNCPDCFEELEQSAQSAATWAAAGLEFSALCVDAPEHHAEAQELLRAALAASVSARELPSVFASAQLAELLDMLVEHVVARPGARALPFSLLIDSTGTAQVLYLGPIPRERVLSDAQSYGLQPRDPRSRGVWPGMWLFGQTRDLAGFSRLLRERGLNAEADFYRDVLRMGVGR